jgi:opacity protein-like surface antigen
MKKILLSSILAFALSSNANAADPSLYPSSITIMTGYTVFSQECKVNSNHAYSFRFTQNDFGIDNFGIGAFQLALDYTPDIPYKTLDEQTSSIKFGPNLLWYLDNTSEVTPYLLLGLGVENLTNPKNGFNSLDFYANAGAGAEYILRDDISLVAEAKYSYSDPKRKGTTVSAGLKFSFGE